MHPHTGRRLAGAIAALLLPVGLAVAPSAPAAGVASHPGSRPGVPPDTQPPSRPTGLHLVKGSPDRITLAWSPATDNARIARYILYQDGSALTRTTRTRTTITGLTPGTTATYAVRAADRSGNLSPASATLEVSTPRTAERPRHHAVGYFTQWGIYGSPGFFIKNLVTSGTAERLTHINYAFANVSPDGKCFEANQAGQGDAWADYQRPVSAEESVDGVADDPGEPLAGSFNQLRKLKARYPHLKVLVSIGGWSWSENFSDAALTKRSRREFVASCIDLFLRGNLPRLDGSTRGGPGAAAGVFDGIDLDWEWPGSEGEPGNIIRPEDKRNFTLLLAEFRRQLNRVGARAHKHYELTAFVPAAPAKIEAGYEVDKAFRYLDFATVQGYDLHGSWESRTNHQAGTFSPPDDPSPVRFSADLAISTYLDGGAPARKLVLGVPFYGHGWTGVTDENDGLFQPATGCAPAPTTCGSANYRWIKTLEGFTTHHDPVARAGWRFDGETFWTFDDPKAMAQKMAYVREMGLGGAMIWSLDGDTADGELIAAIAAGL